MVARISGSVGSYESGAVNRTADIKTIQQLLTSASTKHDSPQLHPGTVDGKIHRVGSRSGTVRAITHFQQSRVGMRRADQRVDVNGKTWKSLIQTVGAAPSPPPPPPPQLTNPVGFAQALTKIAIGEVGVMEDDTNNTGDDLLKYKQATWLQPGAWAWCAAFVCWCYQEALKKHPIAGLNRPQTAAAWDFERWANTQSKVELHKPPGTVRAGDIVVFTFSHIGIAVADEHGGSVSTVEGNTNLQGTRDGGGRTRDGVYRKSRSKSLIRSVIRAL